MFLNIAKNIYFCKISMSLYLNCFNISKKTYTIFLLYFLFRFLIKPITCDDKKERNVIDIFKLVMSTLGIVIVVLIVILIYFKCIKPKLDARKKNRYYEGSKILENEDQEETSLRKNVIKYGKIFLSKYISQKLVGRVYTDELKLFGNQCNICFDYFSEGYSEIIFGGCVHFFHKKCIEQFFQGINLEIKLIPQFICPLCKVHLFYNINKMKNFIKTHPNFLEEMYKKKKKCNIDQAHQYFNEVLDLYKDEESNINIINNNDIKNEDNVDKNNINNENCLKNESNTDYFTDIEGAKSDHEKKIPSSDRDMKYNDINDINICIEDKSPKALKKAIKAIK